jgi:hypothetical protein
MYLQHGTYAAAVYCGTCIAVCLQKLHADICQHVQAELAHGLSAAYAPSVIACRMPKLM